VVVNDSLARARAGDEAAFDRLTDAYRKELQAHCYRSLGSVQDAVLHRNLKGRNPASDPFGKKGRAWIAEQGLPVDERLTVDAGLRQLDFVGGERAQIDEVIAQQALGDEDVRGLMTIPGIDVVCAATLAAVIGDVRGFPTSRHLVGYLGLHPTIRPSGNSPARHRPRVQGGLGRRPPRTRRGACPGPCSSHVATSTPSDASISSTPPDVMDVLTRHGRI